jgi:histidyl-tRNA synthetase
MSEDEQAGGSVAAASTLRSRGMRDLGPEEMAAFRRVEARFLEVMASARYLEIRTPTIEPLHLYTASGSLSPTLLDRVYSFLDWDGWSGERVVLRPDTTVAAARWYEERRETEGASEPARLCYVQPVYRFASEGDREQWQCGVELFGLAAPEGDVELLLLARRFVEALGLRGVKVDLAHAGLVRAALEAAGLDAVAQVEAYDRLLGGDTAAVEELLVRHPRGSSALRLLFGVDGDAAGYLANLRATLVAAVPAAASAVAELEAVAAALDGAGVAYRVRPGNARNFEYYSGVTFVLRSGDVECVVGGRYDGLGEAIGGRAAPASGWGADLLRLAALTEGLAGAR